ncbi:MAG TPA: aminoglycoside 6-adenylyltransferase [Chthoniobacterales bacterium]|nr:aminoglycoside 6-adenylyltransferase [Chthoniobacterales bacterium]
MQDLIERFATWAQDQTDVRSTIVLGSQARVDPPADNLSDLDLAVILIDPSIYLSDITWLRSFGEPCITFVESTAVGNFREQRVLFKDGRDVDVSLLPAILVERMIEQQVPAEIADVLSRGFKILVDKDGLAERLTDKARWAQTVDKVPTESKWIETSHDFLYHVVWAAKKARRGELWVAKSSCDAYQKNLLLLLIEWHARMKGQRDTWHKGRFLERWADRAVLQELPRTFAEYTLVDVQRAIMANLLFYERFGREVANALGYDFPDEAYSFAADQLKQLIREAH